MSMSKQMVLPRRELLRRQSDFKSLFADGHKFVGRGFVIRVRFKAGSLKVGFRSTKSVGGAVRRNRAKRIMRELYRLNRAKIAKDCHILFGARKAVLHNTFMHNMIEFTSLLEKSGVMESKAAGTCPGGRSPGARTAERE